MQAEPNHMTSILERATIRSSLISGPSTKFWRAIPPLFAPTGRSRLGMDGAPGEGASDQTPQGRITLLGDSTLDNDAWVRGLGMSVTEWLR
jgi:hypothetical protein